MNLQLLLLRENPHLSTPPPEIVSQDTRAVLDFLRELADDCYYKYEAKVILVGEGGTGKSSLLRALHEKEFMPNLATTHGIEVDQLSVPHPYRSDQLLTLNTWDFGGQDIYRATHQFFLTKRSLYLVVWNARVGGEQGKLDYWLSTIRVLAPDSPILLVATYIDERQPDINVPRLRADYPQIKEVLQVSNKDGRRVTELREIIVRYAVELPLMGQPWPRSWVNVETALIAKTEQHISSSEYMNVCAANNIRAELAQGSLGSYLHDLGKILYFQDDTILDKMVVLKPNWVTKAISFVLEDEVTRQNNGILAHSDLSRIWALDEDGNSYDPQLYLIFLRLMERFELCYQIYPPWYKNHATDSLVPQLLPYQPPSFLPSWSPIEGKTRVQMIYHLDFVPAGVMSWFMVRTHRYTTNLHWREGVVLRYNEHYARIELSPKHKKIHLDVWGVEPRTFLVILKDTLDQVLQRFEGLQVQ